MTRDELVAEIQRVATASGGRIGLRAFCKASGVNEHEILGNHFARWNDALMAAGIPTASFLRPRTDETAVLEAVARLISRLERWPSENDLKLARREDSLFPSFPVIRRLIRNRTLAQKIAGHCADKLEFQQVRKLAAERASTDLSEAPRPGRAAITGYVYMMRSGRRYKIGYTSSPTRRHREVRLELPDPTDLVHTIPTDDPVGIEAYWHNRFKSKRVRDTEFFTLDAAEVAAFKSRKYQ
jgi:hypothetical protein